LRALSREYRVHLAAFVDDPSDWAHEEVLKEICASLLLLPLHPAKAKIRSLAGLLTGEPLSLPYYRDSRLSRWLRNLHGRTDIENVFVYSSAMAQYATGSDWSNARRVIDFVDVDSDKWRQYAQQMSGPMRWIYAREARRLESYDKGISRLFDASVFVSRAEAEWFCELLEDGRQEVTFAHNGVDTCYFDPGLNYQSPFPNGVRALVFTGAMDYWANAEAVSWFAKTVWPKVVEKVPSAVFYIVGSRPREDVKALSSQSVTVTGRVPDVRPYLRYASGVVAPMRIARGIQNKVLEGMAMARTVLVSSRGLEGITAGDGVEVVIADKAEAFSARIIDLLINGEPDLGAAARRLVCRDYAWEGSEKRLLELVEGRSAGDP
jgi:sugar transferase (PEP-CTERM/EpsH1 system associated)